jgi:cytochrome P450
MMDVQRSRFGQAKARWHEFLVRLCNRPFSFLFLESIRHFGDVIYIPSLGYFVHEPRIARALLEHPNISNKEIGSYGAWFTQVLGDNALFNMEGPEHRQLRSLLRRHFERNRFETLSGDDLRRSVETIRKRLERGDEVDLADAMQVMTARVFGHVLGIELRGPRSDNEYRQLYFLCTQLTARAALVKRLLSPADVEAAKAVHHKIAAYSRAAYERTDANPLSVVGGLKAAGHAYAEVEGLLTALLIAGTALVTLGVPRIVAVLLDTGVFAELRKDTTLLDRAIDECLRYMTLSNVLFRATTADTEVHGYTFPEGSRVYVVFYSIMRHRRYVRSARRLDVHRTVPSELKHLLFGFGPHSCLGVPLVQQIFDAMLRMLITLEGDVRITRRAHAGRLPFPGYKRLCIALKSPIPAAPAR